MAIHRPKRDGDASIERPFAGGKSGDGLAIRREAGVDRRRKAVRLPVDGESVIVKNGMRKKICDCVTRKAGLRLAYLFTDDGLG